jgi:serine protease Do
MAYTPQGLPTQGLGFAIPGEVVRAKVDEFKQVAATKATARKSGPRTLARKFFGLQLQDLTPELRESFGSDARPGVLIADVDPQSPAAQAGLKQGLVIHQVGRYEVGSSKQVEDLLEQVEPGSTVDFSVGVIRRVLGRNLRQLQPVPLTAR